MTILAAIKREERKLEKQLGKLSHKLSGVRAAARALGHSAHKEIKEISVTKKRVLSAAGRAAIVKAAKKQWQDSKAARSKRLRGGDTTPTVIVDMPLKRPVPLTSCTACGNAGYNLSLANSRCGKNIGGKRCEGTNMRATGHGDWQECSFCQAIGVEHNAPCSQCRGVGWLFLRSTQGV